MFYPSNVQARPEYAAAYPAGPVATSPRMNWSPTVHPGAHWGHYPDFSAYPTAAYPSGAGSGGDAQRSPPYHISSPNEPTGTPHNIRDILGAQPGGTLPSEVAKTPSNYQKSPTSSAAAAAAMAFSSTAGDHLRSPSGTPTQTAAPIVYSEVPGFYVPALSRLPGHGPG